MEKKGDHMSIGIMIYMMTEIAKVAVTNENAQKIFNDPKEQFDVVIAEWMFSDLPAG